MFIKNLLYLYFSCILCSSATLRSAAHPDPAPGALPAVAPYTGTLSALQNTIPISYSLLVPFTGFNPDYTQINEARAAAYNQGKKDVLMAAGLLVAGGSVTKLSPSIGLSLIACAAGSAVHEIVTNNDSITLENESWHLSVLTGPVPWGLLHCKHYHLWHGTPDYLGYKAQCTPELTPFSGQDDNQMPTLLQSRTLLNYIYNDLLPQRATAIGRLEGRKDARTLITTTGILVGGLEYFAPNLKSLLFDKEN